MKRASGEGTWVARGSGWELRFMVDRQRYSVYGKTKAICSQKKTAMKQRLEQGKPARDRDVTLSEWIDIWVQDHLPSLGLRPATEDLYRSMLVKHVKPVLGSRKLGAVKPSDIDRLIRQSTLAASSKRSMFAALTKAFRSAVVDKEIAHSPMVDANRPAADEYESRALTDAQVNAILAAAQGHPWLIGLQIMAVTGVRRGELLALTVDSLDVDRRVLQIRGTLGRSSKGLAVGEPKTRAGVRDIPIPDDLVELIKAHRLQQRRLAMQFGPQWQSPALISGDLGEWVDPRRFSRFYAEMAEKAGVDDRGCHAMRHAAATRFVQAIGDQVSVKDVTTLMGHSRSEITLDLYAKAQEAGQEVAVRESSRTLNLG